MRAVFPERFRRTTILVGAFASVGLAEQHHHPAVIISEIPGARWPSDDVNVWVVLFTVSAVLCVISWWTWPRQMILMRFTAILFASALFSRSTALLITYGVDLWGTVAQIYLTSFLIVSSWSWSGSVVRHIRPFNEHE